MQIEIKVEELRKKKIFVATPMFAGQCAGMYTKACIDLATMCANYGVECKFFFIFNESLITRARNYLVDEFLRAEEFTHLMFIDADIHFDPRDVLSLAVLCEDDKPIIGGPYGKKCIAWEKIVQAVDAGIADKDPEELPIKNRGGVIVFDASDWHRLTPVLKGTRYSLVMWASGSNFR